jgi:hypothetical protein
MFHRESIIPAPERPREIEEKRGVLERVVLEFRGILGKQPGRAPSFESVTTEDRGQGVDGLAATTTQTALFTAASSRT